MVYQFKKLYENLTSLIYPNIYPPLSLYFHPLTLPSPNPHPQALNKNTMGTFDEVIIHKIIVMDFDNVIFDEGSDHPKSWSEISIETQKSDLFFQTSNSWITRELRKNVLFLLGEKWAFSSYSYRHLTFSFSTFSFSIFSYWTFKHSTYRRSTFRFSLFIYSVRKISEMP